MKKALPIIISVAFWLIVWEMLAITINLFIKDSIVIFPPVSEVIAWFFTNAFLPDRAAEFWLSILLSLLRVMLGFIIGVITGVLLAFGAHYSRLVYHLLRPIITVTRCTPVASLIMIMWLLLSESAIPILIVVFMVFPIVWQATYDSLENPNPEFEELAHVFAFSPMKKLMNITIPVLIKDILPSIITASGLAWKSGIAAEIITWTDISIGREIANAKNLLEGPELFAWTSVVIVLSLIVESAIRLLLKEAEKIWQ